MTNTHAHELWSRVFLIAGEELQQTMLAQALERNGCNVVIYANALAVPEAALSDETIAPFAILTPAMQINSLKKSPTIEALLMARIPLIGLKQSLQFDRGVATLQLNDGTDVNYSLVKQLAAPEVLKILCETYDKDYGDLPISQRSRR